MPMIFPSMPYATPPQQAENYKRSMNVRPKTTTYSLSPAGTSETWLIVLTDFLYFFFFFHYISLSVAKMSSRPRVLLLGATGETGGSILEGLLEADRFVRTNGAYPSHSETD